MIWCNFYKFLTNLWSCTITRNIFNCNHFKFVLQILTDERNASYWAWEIGRFNCVKYISFALLYDLWCLHFLCAVIDFSVVGQWNCGICALWVVLLCYVLGLPLNFCFYSVKYWLYKIIYCIKWSLCRLCIACKEYSICIVVLNSKFLLYGVWSAPAGPPFCPLYILYTSCYFNYYLLQFSLFMPSNFLISLSRNLYCDILFLS